MANVLRRLDALAEKISQGQSGFLVVHENPETGALTERAFWRADPGREYTRAEIDELKRRGWEICRVVYVKDWRAV